MYWILALHFAIDDYPFVFFNLIVPEQKVRFFLGAGSCNALFGIYSYVCRLYLN